VGDLGMVVHLKFRGCGPGTQRLAHAISTSDGKFEVLRLVVWGRNVRAQRPYKKFGFIAAGRLPRAFGRGEEPDPPAGPSWAGSGSRKPHSGTVGRPAVGT
jgi:ribosomal protein S18 acetylase RimI-like enzyme